MAQELFTVSEVANQLRLHVKTVLNFVHEGQLKAMRIGKQYRITPEDLAAFTRTASPVAVASAERHGHRAEVSCVLHIDAIEDAQADNIAARLAKSAAVHRPGAEPARLDTSYNAEQKRLKVILSGEIEDVVYLMGLVPAFTTL